MRSLIIKILATMASFYATTTLVAGFAIQSTWQAYLLTAVIFLLFNLLVAPIIKLLLLPINLLTLGLFRWFTQVLVLYLFDIFSTSITISAYRFDGYTNSLLALPATNLNIFWAYVVSALVMSLTYNLVTMLLQGDN